MVFTMHLCIFDRNLPEVLQPILSNGAYGVSIFFVISGYLIFASLERTTSVKEFYRKRLVRILPAYYTILLFAYVVWDRGMGMMPEDTFGGLGWIRYIFCISTWIPSNAYDSWNNLWGLWTIPCFMFFYLIAPLLYRWVKKFSQAAVLLVLVIGGTMVLAHVGSSVVAGLGADGAASFGVDHPIYSLNTFFLGITAFLARKEGKESERNYVKLLLGLLAGMMVLGVYNRVTWGILATLVMIVFMEFNVRQDGLRKVIKVMSRYSFSLYLVHLGVMRILEVNGILGMRFYLIAVPTCLLVAVLLNLCVETPVANLARKVTSRKK